MSQLLLRTLSFRPFHAFNIPSSCLPPPLPSVALSAAVLMHDKPSSMVRSDRSGLAMKPPCWVLHIVCVRRGKNGAGASSSLYSILANFKSICVQDKITPSSFMLTCFSFELADSLLSVWPLSLPCLLISSPNTHTHTHMHTHFAHAEHWQISALFGDW